MDIQLKGKTKGTEIEINDSFIKSATDEQLAEVRKKLVEDVQSDGTISITFGTFILIFVCILFAFKALLTVLVLLYVVMMLLYHRTRRTMKQQIIQIDAELARRKTKK